MDARLKSSLLWGLSGAFVFLVLYQGALLAGLSLGVGVVLPLVVAVVVGVVVASVTYATEERIARKGST